MNSPKFDNRGAAELNAMLEEVRRKRGSQNLSRIHPRGITREFGSLVEFFDTMAKNGEFATVAYRIDEGKRGFIKTTSDNS
jgi:hypothetical protein